MPNCADGSDEAGCGAGTTGRTIEAILLAAFDFGPLLSATIFLVAGNQRVQAHALIQLLRNGSATGPPCSNWSELSAERNEEAIRGFLNLD